MGKKVVGKVEIGGEGVVDVDDDTLGSIDNHQDRIADAELEAGGLEGGKAAQKVGSKRPRDDDVEQGPSDADSDRQQQPGLHDHHATPSSSPPAAANGSTAKAKASTMNGTLNSTSQHHDENHDDNDDDNDDDDDDDDFLVVKQHNVFDADLPPTTQPTVEATATDTAAAAATATPAADVGKKKRKRQRIKLGGVSGQRVMFDEDGNTLDPLEMLARSGELEHRSVLNGLTNFESDIGENRQRH